MKNKFKCWNLFLIGNGCNVITLSGYININQLLNFIKPMVDIHRCNQMTLKKRNWESGLQNNKI